MLTGLVTVFSFFFISLHFGTRNIEITSQSQVKDMVDSLSVFFSVGVLKEGSWGGKCQRTTVRMMPGRHNRFTPCKHYPVTVG